MGGIITNRERMQATLAGEITDNVPAWIMGFFNAAIIRQLIPADLLVDDLAMWPEAGTLNIRNRVQQRLWAKE